MKARLEEALPSGDQWLFELKLDGIRAVVIKNGERVQLFSRLPRELTADFPQIVAALEKLPARQLVMDGELIALDERGRSSFQLLQNRRSHPSDGRPILLYLFDLMHLDGQDLKASPLTARRVALERLLKKQNGPLRFSPTLAGTPDRIWKEILRHGLEGLVAKQKDSPYEPGRRSGAWLKIKAQLRQEFVIGGYTAPEGARLCFGAILVGYYQGNELIFASKVGTGFDTASLKSLYRLFQKQRRTDCPFSNLPTRREGRAGQGL